MIVYTTPGVVAALWLLRIRESPRFLLMKNEHSKAVDVMQWINRTNKGKACGNDLAIGKLENEVQVNKVVATNDKNT